MKKVKNLLLLHIVLLSVVSATAQSNSSKEGTNLFDGTSLNGWKKLGGTADYKVEDGMIIGSTVINSPNTFLCTEKEYGDFILELEVKIDDSSSNSGVQVRSHLNDTANNGKGGVYGYQCEFDPSVRKWSGGLYDEGRRDWLYPMSLHAAAQNAFKMGEFNKVRIECIGYEIKTWINDVACAYMLDTFDNSGFIGLQVHSIGNDAKLAGEKIYFKNIRIQTDNLEPREFPQGVYVLNNIPNSLSDYEKKDGWKLLFDGATTNGWIGAYKTSFPEKGWQVKDGELTVLPSEGKESANGGDIVTTDQYSAFDLSFEFKITQGGNSGVKYFVTLSEHNEGSAIGLEYQILDDAMHPDAKLGHGGNRTMASLYDLIAAQKQSRFVHPVGQWNLGRIIVYRNNHVEHYLNGVKVLEYERGSKEFRDLVAISKYVIWKNFGEAPQGHILLQDHGDAVSFKSIKLKELQ